MNELKFLFALEKVRAARYIAESCSVILVFNYIMKCCLIISMERRVCNELAGTTKKLKSPISNMAIIDENI